MSKKEALAAVAYGRPTSAAHREQRHHKSRGNVPDVERHISLKHVHMMFALVLTRNSVKLWFDVLLFTRGGGLVVGKHIHCA